MPSLNAELIITPEEIAKAKVEGIDPVKVAQLRVLALVGYAMMIKQEPKLGTRQIMGNIGLKERVEAAAKTHKHPCPIPHIKSQPLCEFEIKVLRATRGDFDMDWGAAVGASLEFLKGDGYVSGNAGAGWKITEKGEKFLAGLDVLTLEAEERKEPCLHQRASFAPEGAYCPDCGATGTFPFQQT